MHNPLYEMRKKALDDAFCMVENSLVNEKLGEIYIKQDALIGIKKTEPGFCAFMSEVRFTADWLLEGQPATPEDFPESQQTTLNFSGTFESAMSNDSINIITGRHSRKEDREELPDDEAFNDLMPFDESSIKHECNDPVCECDCHSCENTEDDDKGSCA